MIRLGGWVASNEYQERFGDLEARAADIRGYL
jgi:hypothetical protein